MLRLSNSGADKHELCPRLFKYHYIDKIRSKNTTTAILFGSAIDESMDILLKKRNLAEAKDLFFRMFENTFLKNASNLHIYNKDYDWNTLNDEDISKLNDMEDSRDKELEYAYRSLRGKGVDFLNKVNEEFLDKIDSVIDSQIEVTINNGKYTIIGYIDFILKMKDGSVLLVDLKTSSKSYSDRMLNESHQLHLYYFCLDLMKKRGTYTGELPEKISYLVLRKDYNTKGEMRDIQFKSREPDKDFTLQVINRFDILIKDIESNNFKKTDKKYNCTKQFGKKCEYYELCQQNTPLEDIDHLEQRENK